MKEKNKSKFYVKSSIIAIILILLGTVLFFAVNNNTGILKISSIKEKMTEKSMDDTIKSGTVYINTEAEFALFVKEFNKNAENSEQDIITVYLQKDLDLKDYDNWERISLNHNNRNNHVPKIIFDGQGHVIKNMKMNYDDGNGAGLFIDYVNQNEIHVTIKKLGITDSTIFGDDPSAAFVGGQLTSANISDCYVTNSTITSDSSAASFVGDGNGIIENCYTSANITGASAGGIAGQYDGIIRNCYNVGKVKNTSDIGYKSDGICPYPTVQIENCYYQSGTNSAADNKATKKGEAEMQTSNFKDLLNKDGSNHWKFPNPSKTTDAVEEIIKKENYERFNYPVLSWQPNPETPTFTVTQGTEGENDYYKSEVDLQISVNGGIQDEKELYVYTKENNGSITEANKTASQNITLPASDNATYTVTAVYGYDNGLFSTATKEIKIDSKAPTIDKSVEGAYVSGTNWYNQGVKIVVDDINKRDKFDLYYKNSENSSELRQDGYENITYTDDGYYRVVAKDKAGNIAEYRFGIDNVSPTGKKLIINDKEIKESNTEETYWWFDETVKFDVKPGTDSLSGVHSFEGDVRWYDEDDEIESWFTSGGKWEKEHSWEDDESILYEAWTYCMDRAGNNDRSGVTIYFKIDHIAPTNAKPTLTPSTNSITVQSKQVEESQGSGVAKIEYGYCLSENGNYTWQPSSDTINTTYTITGLNDDTTYYVKTRMTDNVGHVTTSNATQTKTVSLDTTAPTITANPQNIQTYTKSGTIVLNISENVTETNLQYKWTTDSSDTAPNNWDTTQIQEKSIASVTATGMTGEYYLWVGQVTDSHKNASTAKKFGPYKFDNEAPTISSVSEETTEYTKGPVTLTATAQDQQSGIVAWQFSTKDNLRGNEDGWQAEESANTSTFTKKIQVTENGQYYFYVKDAAGNVKRSDSAINVYNIEKEDGITPPTITATVNGENYKSGTYTKGNVTLTISGGNAKSGIEKYQYSKDGGQTWRDCASGNTITITDEGITTITARLKSNAGYYSDSSEPFVVNIDKTAPTCEITVTPDTSLTNDSRTIYTFKFSEPVVDFSQSDITITGGGDGSTFTNVFLEDPLTNTEYTLIVNNGNNSKYTQKLTINANACHDRAGNGNESATNSIEVDRKKPTCAITAENVTNNITNSNQTTYKFTFDEGVEGFNADDIIITSGEKGTFSVTNNKEYTIIVNNADEIDTTEVVSIADGACTDVAGNPNTASSSNSIEVDRKRPTCEITTSKSSPTKDDTITYEIKFSESLKNDLQEDNVTVANGSISSFSGSADKYTVDVNGGSTGNQTISVKDNIVQDNAGNGNILASKSIEIDRSAPEIEKITKTPDSWTNGSVTLTIEGAKDQGAAGLDSAPYSFDGGDTWTASNSKVYNAVANNVTVKIKDKLGNEKTETVNIDKIDKTGPNISTVTANSSNWTNTAVTLTGSAQSTESKIKYYQFSTESNLTATSENWKEVTVNNSISETHTISDQTTGITTWYFYVKDEAGNVSKGYTQVKQDYTAPTVSFGNQGDSAYKKESSVNITLSDDGCGKIKQNSKLQYAWSKSNKEEPSAWQEAEITENTATATESGLTGEYYLWVKDGITDEVGNSTKNSIVSTSRFYFDNSAPEINIKPDGQENLDGTAYTKTKNIDIEIKDNVTLKSSSLSYAFDKSNVNEPNDWTNNISISNNTAKIENVGSGLTGVYYLWIKEGIEDNLNNETTKATVSDKAFYFDNTNPKVTIEETTVGAKEITAKVKAVENDSGLVKGSSYKYYIKSNDGNYVLEQTTDNTAYTFTGLNEGVNYSIKVEATDNAQNVGSITTSATTKVNVSSIDITPNPAEVKVGSTVELTAAVKPENANNKTVVWTSSDTSIATVSDGGLVTALSEGTVTITVTAEGGIKATSTVTVNPREVTNGLTITDPSWTSGFASVTVTGNTNGNKIEYSINDENGVYKTLTNGTISGLSHGDTVYVRESDGVYYSPVKSKRIIDDKYPTLEVMDNATSWQNSYVTLTITSKDTESGLEEVKINDDILTINNGTAKYTVTTNGTYEITAVDRAGNKTSKTEQVTYIDTEKPKIEVEKDTQEFVKDGVKLIIRATDNQSGVKTVKVNDQDTTNQNGIYEYTATNNDSYIIKVTDNAGNVATYTEIVDNIDDIAPELSVRYRPNYEFNTVTVTVVADEPIQAVSGWKLSSDKMILTKTYSQNKKDNITVKDLVGNAKEQEINVDQIDDVELKVASVTYDPQKNKMTSDRVRVTIQVNKQVLAVDGWSMSDEGTTLTKDFYNNEVERVILYDLVGNSIPQVISVTQIDNKAPKVVDVIYSTKDQTKDSVNVTIKLDEEVNAPNGWELTNSNRSITKTYLSNQIEDVEITDKVGNKTVQIIKVENIDKTAPTANVMYSITTPTNGSVDVTIKASEEIESVPNWKLSDNGTTLKRTYSDNKTETVTITDLAGNTHNVDIKVSNIDKDKPEATVTYQPNTATKDSVKAIIEVNEQVLGINEWNLQPKEDNKYTLTKTYSENKNEKVVVEDLAGNKAEVTVNVDKIDKIAPELAVSYSTKQLTNEEVTVTITANEDIGDISNLDGWTKSSDNRTLTKGFDFNTSQKVTVKDVVGNEAIAQIDISNIDKKKPTATVTYSTKDPTNKAITVQIHASEKVKEMADWVLLEDGVTLERTYSENKTETVTITDLAGNTQEVEIDIKNIDRDVPKVNSIEYNPNKDTLTNKTVVVTITVNEDIQDVAEWTLDQERRTLTKEYSLNMDETVTITDLAGNKTEAKVNVTNIDKEELAAEVSYSTKDPTNGSVTATIRANKKLKNTHNDWTYEDNKMILSKEYTNNVDESIDLEDEAGNTKTVKVRITNIDKDAPTYDVSYSTTKPTNGVVKVQIRANEPLKDVQGWELADKAFVLTKDYSENVENEKVTITDLAGNTAEVTINISNIDTTPPVVQKIEYSPSEATNGTVKVTIYLDEKVIAIPDWDLSEDEKQLSKEYFKNTKEKVTIIDLAGNSVEAEVNVTNIEKASLEAVVTYDIIDWTNQDVTATITANKPLKPQGDGWQLSENKMVLTKIFKTNYAGQVIIESEAGNKKQVVVSIDNIDKTPPTEPTIEVIQGTKGENDWYISDEVLLKVTEGRDLESGLLQTTYEIETKGIDNKEEIRIRSGNTFSIAGEGEYIVRAYQYDIAGNKTVVETPVIVNIDTNPPVISEFKQIEVKPNRFTVEVNASDWPSNIQSYDFYLNEEKIQSSLQAQYSLTSLKQNTTYTIYVIVRDNAGHETRSEETFTITTPMVPSGGDDTEVQPNPDDPTKPAQPDVTPVDPDTVDPDKDIDGDGNPDGTPGSNYNIKATPVTWENEEATTTLSIVEKYRADFDIEYQINGTDDDKWIKGEEGKVTEEGTKITGLLHGDIIYARLTDGENYGPYIAYVIMDKNAPQEFKLSIEDIRTDGFIIKGGTVDNESGIERYEYYINENLFATVNVDEEEEKIEPEEREYNVTGLMQNSEYTVKVVAVDRAQNKTEEILEETVTTKGIPGGKDVVDPDTPIDPDDPNKPIDPDSPDNPFGQNDKYKPDPEDSHKPTRPEYTIGWSIEVTPVIWENEKASITLSTKTEFAIEYQINSAEDGKWTQGEEGSVTKEGTKVTELLHGSIVYARLTDGTNHGDYIAVIVLDETTPESFTVTIEDVKSDGFMVKGGTKDNESGIEKYEYYVNDELKLEANTPDNRITGLMQNQKYTVKVVAIDRAGNQAEAVVQGEIQTGQIPGGGETVNPEDPDKPINPGGDVDPENPGGDVDPDNPGGETDPDKPVNPNNPEQNEELEPEETIGLNIEAKGPTWNEGKAKLELETQTSYRIEYQINGIEEGNWTEGNIVEGLDHKDIVHARLTDGTNHGDYISIIILDKISPNVPTISVVEGNEVEKDVYEGITKVKIEEGKDSETGTIKTKYTINGEEIETTEDVTLTLTKNGEYKIEAYSIDKAGNKSETATRTIIVQGIPDDYFYSDIYEIEEENLYITKVKPHTDYAEFKKHIFTNLDYIVVREQDRVDIQEEELIKTGDILKVKDKEYRLIVTGDIDKDGECAISDLSRLKRLIIQEVELEDIQERAADVNYDKDANISDLSRIVKYIIGMIKF